MVRTAVPLLYDFRLILLSEDDHARFREALDACIDSGQWLDTQVRMKVKTSTVTWTEDPETFVTLEGRPEWFEDDDGARRSVVFLYAKHRSMLT